MCSLEKKNVGTIFCLSAYWLGQKLALFFSSMLLSFNMSDLIVNMFGADLLVLDFDQDLLSTFLKTRHFSFE